MLLCLRWAVLAAIGLSAAVVLAQDSPTNATGGAGPQSPERSSPGQPPANARRIPDSLIFADGLLASEEVRPGGRRIRAISEWPGQGSRSRRRAFRARRMRGCIKSRYRDARKAYEDFLKDAAPMMPAC